MSETEFESALYVVATPLGNLGDITLRALALLKCVDLVLAEDTRLSVKLLHHYGITKPLKSYREAMSEAAFSKVLEQVDSILQAGGKVALVSDAGTPGIADPGGKMVEQIVMRGQRVIPIPGPASVTTLLSISGLALQNVLFMGFLPKKKGRQTDLKKMVALLEDGFVEGVVIYESPHRIVKLLEELSGSLLTLVLGRELTKKFEEVRRGSPEELLLDFGARKSVKGEITLLVTKLGV